MSVQNLATVFGPNILRPQVEDPVTIMEGKEEVAWLGGFELRASQEINSLDVCLYFLGQDFLPSSPPFGAASS